MLRAKDIMTHNVITVKPDTTIEELSRILVENKISGAPVVDDSGSLLGIVTENDLINRSKRLHIPTVLRVFDAFIILEGNKRIREEIKRITATRVEDIYTRNPITVTEDTPIDEIATIMSEKKVHLLPVMSGGRITGIIGKIDIIRAMSKKDI